MGVRNFWNELPKPFFALAPLANVTDAAFRQIIAKYSKPRGPDIFYTEFVSADGLIKGNRKLLMKDLLFGEAQRPIVAQFFTGDPAMMEQAAALAQELGFDGVDINMGCPDRSVEKAGGGAALIKNPKRAQELVAAAKRGAPKLPVSVKTRLGYRNDTLEEWLPVLLEAQPVAVVLHARTRKEMSKVDAHWERVQRAVEIRNELTSDVLIVGNGDLTDIEDAKKKVQQSGADGAMLGRAIFGTPWLFSSPESAFEKILGSPVSGKYPPLGPDFSSTALRLHVLVEHTKLFEELLGEVKNFAIMKKHFKAYCEGFPGAKELRIKLMEAENATHVEAIVKSFLP